MEGKVIDISSDVSFQSQKSKNSKNYVLKSSFMHGEDNSKQATNLSNVNEISFSKFKNNPIN